MPLVASDLLGALAENWWLLLLRGLAAIAFGLIAFFWPGMTLVALTYLWGAYALVDGVVAIWAALNTQGGWKRGPALVARPQRRRQHSRRYRGFRLHRHDSAGAADVHRCVGDHHRRAAALCGGSTAQSDRKRVAARVERSALDRLRRRAHRLAEHRCTGRYLDDRLVRGFRFGCLFIGLAFRLKTFKRTSGPERPCPPGSGEFIGDKVNSPAGEGDAAELRHDNFLEAAALGGAVCSKCLTMALATSR